MGNEESKPTTSTSTNSSNLKKKGTTEVFLNIYTPPSNAQPINLSKIGFGIYHTGIEINGIEYTFAGSEDAGDISGISAQTPRTTPTGSQWKYKESKSLGYTNKTSKEITSILDQLQTEFKANTYHITGKNCNHFTELVAHKLNVHEKYPNYINRAAKFGNFFQTNQNSPLEKERIKKYQQKVKENELKKANTI